MKRAALIFLAMTAIGASAAVAVAAQPVAPKTIDPGYWEYKTRFLGINVDTKRRCLKAEEVDDFLTRPCNRHHTCVYPVKEVGGGKIRLDGYWQNKEGAKAKVKAEGSYSQRAFTLSAHGTSTQGIPIGATIDAKWLAADCPGSTK
ncbi:hypothetical protein BH11PSE2_BH11PSE2_13770 [soil metagenome]